MSLLQKRILIFELAVLIGLSIQLFAKKQILVQPSLSSVSAADIEISAEQTPPASLYDAISYVPAPILQAFISYDWAFSVDPEYLGAASSNLPGYRVGGATLYKEREIKITEPNCAVHEFGHFLDYMLSFPEYHETLFQNESGKAAIILGEYATKNSREYFATYFSYWIYHQADPGAKESLRILSPETFSYFSELEENSWGINTNKIVLIQRT